MIVEAARKKQSWSNEQATIYLGLRAYDLITLEFSGRGLEVAVSEHLRESRRPRKVSLANPSLIYEITSCGAAYLSQSSIDNKIRSIDEAALVAREEQHSLSLLDGFAETPTREVNFTAMALRLVVAKPVL